MEEDSSVDFSDEEKELHIKSVKAKSVSQIESDQEVDAPIPTLPDLNEDTLSNHSFTDETPLEYDVDDSFNFDINFNELYFIIDAECDSFTRQEKFDFDFTKGAKRKGPPAIKMTKARREQIHSDSQKILRETLTLFPQQDLPEPPKLLDVIKEIRNQQKAAGISTNANLIDALEEKLEKRSGKNQRNEGEVSQEVVKPDEPSPQIDDDNVAEVCDTLNLKLADTQTLPKLDEIDEVPPPKPTKPPSKFSQILSQVTESLKAESFKPSLCNLPLIELPGGSHDELSTAKQEDGVTDDKTSKKFLELYANYSQRQAERAKEEAELNHTQKASQKSLEWARIKSSLVVEEKRKRLLEEQKKSGGDATSKKDSLLGNKSQEKLNKRLLARLKVDDDDDDDEVLSDDSDADDQKRRLARDADLSEDDFEYAPGDDEEEKLLKKDAREDAELTTDDENEESGDDEASGSEEGGESDVEDMSDEEELLISQISSSKRRKKKKKTTPTEKPIEIDDEGVASESLSNGMDNDGFLKSQVEQPVVLTSKPRKNTMLSTNDSNPGSDIADPFAFCSGKFPSTGIVDDVKEDECSDNGDLELRLESDGEEEAEVDGIDCDGEILITPGVQEDDEEREEDRDVEEIESIKDDGSQSPGDDDVSEADEANDSDDEQMQIYNEELASFGNDRKKLVMSNFLDVEAELDSEDEANGGASEDEAEDGNDEGYLADLVDSSGKHESDASRSKNQRQNQGIWLKERLDEDDRVISVLKERIAGMDDPEMLAARARKRRFAWSGQFADDGTDLLPTGDVAKDAFGERLLDHLEDNDQDDDETKEEKRLRREWLTSLNGSTKAPESKNDDPITIHDENELNAQPKLGFKAPVEEPVPLTKAEKRRKKKEEKRAESDTPVELLPVIPICGLKAKVHIDLDDDDDDCTVTKEVLSPNILPDLSQCHHESDKKVETIISEDEDEQVETPQKEVIASEVDDAPSSMETPKRSSVAPLFGAGNDVASASFVIKESVVVSTEAKSSTTIASATPLIDLTAISDDDDIENEGAVKIKPFPKRSHQRKSALLQRISSVNNSSSTKIDLTIDSASDTLVTGHQLVNKSKNFSFSTVISPASLKRKKLESCAAKPQTATDGGPVAKKPSRSSVLFQSLHD